VKRIWQLLSKMGRPITNLEPVTLEVTQKTTAMIAVKK
jgi:hypothetical protein